jgi:GNAT superfamily N-acetyltransferase
MDKIATVGKFLGEKVKQSGLRGFALSEFMDDGLLNFCVVGVFSKGIILKQIGAQRDKSAWLGVYELHLYSDSLLEESVCDFDVSEMQFKAGFVIAFGSPYQREKDRFYGPKINVNFDVLHTKPKEIADAINFSCRLIEEDDVNEYHFSFSKKINDSWEQVGTAIAYKLKHAKYWSDRNRAITMDCLSSSGEALYKSVFNNQDVRPEFELLIGDSDSSLTLIDSVYVSEEFRSLGLGSRIMQFLIKYVGVDDSAVCLLAHSSLQGSFKENNLKLMKWYQSLGFSRVNCSRSMVLTNKSIYYPKNRTAKLKKLQMAVAATTPEYVVVPELFSEISETGIGVKAFKKFVANTQPELLTKTKKSV